jgi:CDP-6-deoxy-D-xylo-4-hexulose-3-dehydrase
MKPKSKTQPPTEKIAVQIEALIKKFYAAAKAGAARPADKVALSAPAMDSQEAIRVMRTFLGGWISQGPNVREFEGRFARYVGSAAGIAVNSGSSANLLALHALKEIFSLRDGDEVLLPATTFATVAMPVLQVGLVPVYVDVRRDTMNLDPDQIAGAVSSRTRILMPVHTLGYPADMPRLMELAKRHNLLVLEDCCEAHGSSINGRKAGSFGDIASFSFFVAHNMTTGEGGMITTNNTRLESACRSLREFGRCDQRDVSINRYYSDDVLKDFDRRYVFDKLGYNVRMTDIAAAMGIEQLNKLDAMNKQRRRNAALYRKILGQRAADFLDLPVEEPGCFHTYYTFPMVLKEGVPFRRRELTEYMEARGIETRPLFAGCLPDQPAFRHTPGRVAGSLPNARFLRDNALFIGVHPDLEPQQVRYAANTIVSFLKKYPR